MPQVNIACEQDAHCPDRLICQSPPGRCIRPQDYRDLASDPTVVIPDGQQMVKNGDLLVVRGSGEPGGAAAGARLLTVDDGGDAQAIPPGTITMEEDGSFVGQLVADGLPHGREVALEVIVESNGFLSRPADSRSLPFGVDNIGPTDTRISVAGGPAVPGTAVELTLTATGATEMFIDGDLEDADGVRTWVGFATQALVDLTAGHGLRSLVVDFRDGAGNVSRALASVSLDATIPSSSPTLTGPWGTEWVTDNDTVVVQGTARGAGVASAILLAYDAAGVELVEPGCAVDVTGQVELISGSLSGSFTIGVPCAGAAELAVQVITESSAHTPSPAPASISNTLRLDRDPPAPATAALEPAAGADPGYTPTAVEVLNLSATDAAGSAIEVLITGDLQAGANVDDWLAYPGGPVSENIVLSSGDGPKTIRVRFRDQLHNATSPISLAVTLDTTPPRAPNAGALQLLEENPNPYDPGQIDDANHTFTLTGMPGALSAASRVRLYSDAGLSSLLATLDANGDGSFSSTAVAAVADKTYYLVAQDPAGHQSPASSVTVPKISGWNVDPDPAGLGLQINGEPVDISFTVDIPLLGSPAVSVGAQPVASCATTDGTSFSCAYEPTGAEQVQANTAVVRVVAQPAAYAPGSLGTSAVTLGLDIDPPTLTGGSVVVDQGDPGTDDTIRGDAGACSDDLTPTAQIVVELYDETETTLLDSTTANGDGSFAALSLGDNLHDSVVLLLNDVVGNQSAAAGFANDRVAPIITGLDITPPAQRHGEEVWITFTVTDSSGLRSEPHVTLGGRDATYDAGSVTFTYRFTVDDALDTAGNQVVSVEATDVAGNTSSVTGSVFFDFVAPTCTNTTPGDRPTWNGSPAILGVATDDAAIAAVEVSLQRDATSLWLSGGSFGASSETWLTASGTDVWSYNVTSVTFANGESYNLRWHATDSAGNQGAPGSATFVFDDSLPNAPTDLVATSVGEARIDLTWTAPVGATGNYRVYYDDEANAPPPYAGTGAVNGDSPITVSGATTLTMTFPPPGRRFTFAVVALDAGSNESGYSSQATAASRWWHWRKPETTSHLVMDVIGFPSGLFLAVGGGGTVWRSTDSGLTWTVIGTPTSERLNAIWSDGTRAMAVGDRRVVVRSLDAGLTWEQIYEGGTLHPFWNVWGSGDVVVAIGTTYPWRTDDFGDSGADGSSAASGTTSWSDGTNIVIVGSTGCIRVSNNMGASWFSPDSGTTRSFYGVWGQGADWVAVGSSGVISTSNDTGATWTVRSSGTSQILRVARGSGATVVAFGDAGTITRSTNSGVDWATAASDTTADLTMAWGGGSDVLAANVAGEIVHSSNLGASWIRVLDDPSAPLSALGGSGTQVAAMGRSTILHSSDTGASWSSVDELDPTTLNSVWGEGDVAVAVGEGGTIWQSNDSGQTWTQADSGVTADLNAVAGAGDVVIAVGWKAAVHSIDGGVTWTQSVGASWVHNNVWTDGVTAVAVGEVGKCYTSFDGGATWSLVRNLGVSSNFKGVSGNGANVAIVGDQGRVFASHDYGATWAAKNSATASSLYDVWACDEDLFLAAGSNGTVTVSHDGGESWALASTGSTEVLTGAWGTTDALFAVGNYGIILRSTDAGVSFVEVADFAGGLKVIRGAGDDLVAAGDWLVASHDGGSSWSVPDRVTPVPLAWKIKDIALVAPGLVIGVGQYSTIVQLGPR